MAEVLVGFDERAYHADPCEEPSLSAHIAHILLSESPMHAHHYHPRLGGNRRPASDAQDDGVLVHALLLGKGMDAVEVAIASDDVYSGTGKKRELRVPKGKPFQDWKLGAAQEAKTAIRALGRVPMLQHDFDAIEAKTVVMRDRILAFDERALAGESEVTILWTDYATDGTPVQCRSRLDKLDGWTIRDLKTCRRAHPKVLQRDIELYGYDVQAAAYMRALAAAAPESEGRSEYKWLFCESFAPYPVTPVRFGGSMRKRGEARWQQAVDLWAQCIRTARWPGYVDSEITIEASPWGLDETFSEGDDDGQNV